MARVLTIGFLNAAILILINLQLNLAADGTCLRTGFAPQARNLTYCTDYSDHGCCEEEMDNLVQLQVEDSAWARWDNDETCCGENIKNLFCALACAPDLGDYATVHDVPNDVESEYLTLKIHPKFGWTAWDGCREGCDPGLGLSMEDVAGILGGWEGIMLLFSSPHLLDGYDYGPGYPRVCFRFDCEGYLPSSYRTPCCHAYESCQDVVGLGDPVYGCTAYTERDPTTEECECMGCTPQYCTFGHASIQDAQQYLDPSYCPDPIVHRLCPDGTIDTASPTGGLSAAVSISPALILAACSVVATLLV